MKLGYARVSTDELSYAVKQFRKGLGETQTEFGIRLGYSLPTIQRWELVAAPRGAALIDLARRADETGRTEFAQLFRSALPIVPALPCEWITEEDTLP